MNDNHEKFINEYYEFNPTWLESIKHIKHFSGYELAYKFLDKNTIVLLANSFEIYNGAYKVIDTVYFSEPLKWKKLSSVRIFFDYIKKFLDNSNSKTYFLIDEEYEQLSLF